LHNSCYRRKQASEAVRTDTATDHVPRRWLKTAAESEIDEARRKLKEAQEAFDADAIIAAQEALT
jgi:hypothetical protein